jgi:hypothetical protein
VLRVIAGSATERSRAHDEQNAAFGLTKVQLDAVGPNAKASLSGLLKHKTVD